ncbi:hypothetical protein KEM54_006612 [Ascosphaera aggregata]|nr:hypothetical protein KEM54_006612 [Ascosphaera aggregata]
MWVKTLTATSLSASLLCLTTRVAAQHVINLTETHWTVSNDMKSISVPGKLPSQVHLDLHDAGVIPEPYNGVNDLDLRWVALSNWTYSSKLGKLKKNALKSYLVFDGLDTFATVNVCNQVVGKANNQFRQFKFDITNALKSCKSSTPPIDIRFESAVTVAKQIAEQPGQEQWPAGVENVFQFPSRQFIRKEQSDFGWDWGPAFAPAGPWQPAYVVQFTENDGVYVLNTDLDIYREGQINHLPADQSKPWVVNASIDYLGTLPKEVSLVIEIKDFNNTSSPIASGFLKHVTRRNATITGDITVDPLLPKLWWPSGMGERNLYQVTVKIIDKDCRTLASVTRRSGFRTIFLNQTPITQDQLRLGIAPGANWHFEVNGHEFYVKGSNMIPLDAFWPRVTKTYVSRLFDAVVAGNQNMLRVWASNIYLPDYIYDLADERGILLWSELQFSDDLYPVDNVFLDNVIQEINYNVRRVNHHPSLALWVGGNELENLELPLVYLSDPNQLRRYVKEYEKLFITIAARVVYDNTRSISYTPSSTNNGTYRIDFSQEVPFKERYTNVSPGSYAGDTDYYNYDSSVAFDLSSYPVGRFSNEFGFHSMPSLQTWEDAISLDDLHFNSTTIKIRNHHYPYGGPEPNATNTDKGMGEMTMAVERYYPAPFKYNSVANFSTWCLATQRFQADYYKSQIQFYRRGSGRPERQLGSLYWQLEDIWQAPSWAGIEYGGRWKVLHYAAKDAYKPIIIAPFWDRKTGELNITIISDLWESVSGKVNLTWYDLRGRKIAGNAGLSTSYNFHVGPLNTTDIVNTKMSDMNIVDDKKSILIMTLEAEGHRPNSNVTAVFNHENYFMPVYPNEAKLVNPRLTWTYEMETGIFRVMANKGVSLYTWLDHPKGIIGHFSENNFVLLPNQTKEIEFHLVEDKTQGRWLSGVSLGSLWDQSQYNWI